MHERSNISVIFLLFYFKHVVDGYVVFLILYEKFSRLVDEFDRSRLFQSVNHIRAYFR